MFALTLMLVSLCRDPRSAATSSHKAEVAAGAAAALDAELPADAWPLDELPLEPQAAASKTRPDMRTIRQTLLRTLLILCERDVRFPAPPHPRRVIPRSLARAAAGAGGALDGDRSSGRCRATLSRSPPAGSWAGRAGLRGFAPGPSGQCSST